MVRPRCDGFDVVATRAAIESGKTTARRAYEAYASEAARPYARSMWEILLRTAEATTPPPISEQASPAAYWGERLKVKSQIVTTCADNASLRVRGGSLVVFDGERSLEYAAGGKHPAAIVMAGWGGLVTIEAVRFSASHRIALVALDWMRDLLTIMTPAPKASASILRAQVLADPAWLAKRIVQTKIAEAARAGALPHSKAQTFIEAAGDAVSVSHAMMIEAQAGLASWPAVPNLRWRAGSPRVPLMWKQPWLARARIDIRTKRYAVHPINSMLNVVFSVTAARLVGYLAAHGAHPAIGFLHADKPGRWSLAFDAIEPLRPSIEAKVFAFVEGHRFSADDFIRIKSARGEIRLADELLRVLMSECASSHSDLKGAAGWMVGLIHSAPSVAFPFSVADAPALAIGQPLSKRLDKDMEGGFGRRVAQLSRSHGRSERSHV